MTEEKAVPEGSYDDDGKFIPAVVPPPSTENESEKSVPPEGNTSSVPGEDIDTPEIPVRSSAAHVIARQKRTIERLRSQSQKDEESVPPPEEQESEEDLTPQAKNALNREIQRHIAPLIETLAGKADEEELRGLLAQEPTAKLYEKRIRAYMESPHYKNVPPSVIFHHLAFSAAAAVTAQKKSVADMEAKQMRGGGTSRRPPETYDLGGIPSVEDQEAMDDIAFEELQNKARSGAFIPKR